MVSATRNRVSAPIAGGRRIRGWCDRLRLGELRSAGGDKIIGDTR